ncbi:MAG: hypothetical protein HZC55_24110 [Verrucomicrobia bacterium]|jgi:hypothetical protein|nr:hypothetical protein [Verrucomicrobiota bacterium]
MPQETIVYTVNLIIGLILAGLVTHHWRRAGRAPAMGYWMVAAWVMTAADALFAARPELPNWIGRFFPTLMVTIGHGALLLGARRTAGATAPWRVISALVIVHGAALAAFLAVGGSSKWRMVANGLVWGGLSLASFAALRHSPAAFHRSLLSPATVFLVHGVFHGLRVSLATLFAVQGWSAASASLQIVGDLEVSFFMVALFVSLLISHLEVRHQELSRALTEVNTLTGLLPICAWCRKVRSDDGYWQQLEDYFVSHSHVKFTHGICGDCSRDHFARTATRVR